VQGFCRMVIDIHALILPQSARRVSIKAKKELFSSH
jgi:hypothetical protein